MELLIGFLLGVAISLGVTYRAVLITKIAATIEKRKANKHG